MSYENRDKLKRKINILVIVFKTVKDYEKLFSKIREVAITVFRIKSSAIRCRGVKLTVQPAKRFPRKRLGVVHKKEEAGTWRYSLVLLRFQCPYTNTTSKAPSGPQLSSEILPSRGSLDLLWVTMKVKLGEENLRRPTPS